MRETVILLRVSSDIQDLEMQRVECLGYCEKNEMDVLKILESKESAFKNALEDLVNLQEIITLASQGLITDLVVWKLDRLGRQLEFITFFSQMDAYGVTVHSVTEGIIEGKTSMDKLMLILKLFQGEQEAENTSIRVKTAIKTYNEQTYLDENGEEIEALINGSAPYGYKSVDTRIIRNPKRGTTVKKLAILEEEAAVVRIIFDKYLYEDYGTVKIAHWLNDNGIPTKRGRKWKNNTVLGILNNTIYIGKMRYHVVEYVSPKSKKTKKLDKNDWRFKDVPHLRLISDEEFDKTQRLLVERNTQLNSEVVRGTEHVLLNGIAHCGYCGSKLQISSTKRHNKTRGEYRSYFYNCREGMRDNAHLRKTYPAHVVDKEFEVNVIDIIKNQVLNEIDIKINFSEHQDKLTLSVSNDINKLECELEDKTEELESLEGEVAKSLRGKSDYSPKLLTKLISSVEEDIGKIKSELLSKRSELKIIEQNSKDKLKRIDIFSNFEKLYNEATTLQQRKELIRSIVSRVELKKGEIDVILRLHD